MLLLANMVAGYAQPDPIIHSSPATAYREGMIFLKLKNSTHLTLPNYERGKRADNYPLLGSLISEYGITKVYRPFATNKDPNIQRTYRIEFSANNASVFSLMRDLSALQEVEYAEQIPAEYICYDPNDPKENDGSLWFLQKVNAYQAWDISTGSGNTVIAVVDDAVYTQHEDIMANLWQNPDETAGNGVDDDGNGYVDDIFGADVADDDGNTNPPAALVSPSVFSHGSHCAGIAGGVTNNGVGIASISSHVKIMGVKATADAASSPNMITAGWEGVQYAVDEGADIISLSWGGTSNSQTYQNLINSYEAQGVVIFAAAGNSNIETPFYPAAYNYVVGVAASDQSDYKASYSNYGSWVDLTAPGSYIHGILCTGTSNYGIKSGTSMATPMAASLAGLLKSYNPALSPSELRSCMFSSADNMDALNPTYVGKLGAGRINAQDALVCALPSACVTPYNLQAVVSPTSAVLTWSASPGTASYSVQVREVGAGSWNTFTATTSQYTFSAIACKNYEYRVMSNCGGGSSAYSATATFATNAGGPQGYCTQTSTATFGWIQNVQFAGISNNSGNNSGYSNATCSVATVSSGSSYPITLSPGYNNYSYNQYWRVYIDYNQDGDFADANEMAYESGSASTTTVNGTIAIPNGVATGSTRMRILMKWLGSGDMGLPTPCTNFNYGETEDYTLNVAAVAQGGNVSCPAPANATNGTIGANTATLSWSSTGGSSYTLNYRVSGVTAWTSSTVTSTTTTLNSLTTNTTYQWRVASDCDAYSDIMSFTTTAAPCNVPTNLAATNVGGTGATLTWTAVGGAASYNVRYKASTAANWTILNNVTGTSSTINSLSSSTAYQFQVATNCTTGSGSAYSATQTFNTTAATCNIPANATVSSLTTTTATLAWSAVATATNYSMVYRPTGGSWSADTPVSGTSFGLSQLNPATAYEYQVKANCPSSSSSYSSSVAFTTATPPCSAPTNLAASGLSANSITLGWTAVSNALNYTVRYRVSGSSTWITQSSVTTTGSTVGGLVASTSYELQVGATCSGSSVNYSSSVWISTTTSCGTPGNLSATNLSTTGATLNWTTVSNGSSYNVQYRLNGASSWNSATAFSNLLSLSGLASGSTYQYQVQTNCSNSTTSTYSAVQTFTTTTPVSCGTPTALTTSNVSSSGATFNWSPGNNAVSYNVRYKPITSATWTNTTATTTTKVVTGLSAYTIYEVQTQSICSNTSGTYSGSTNFTTSQANACGTPASLSATNVVSNGATLGWGAVSGANQYTVQYKPSAGSTWSSVTATTNSLVLSGLSASTSYDYRTMTTCNSGSSPYSGISNFTTTAAVACGVPTNLSMSSITNTAATATWTAVSGATQYTLQYKATTATAWASVTTTAANRTLSGLGAATAYELRVMATCTGGSSTYTSIVNFTTLSAATCGVPAGVSVGSLTATSAVASWAAVSDATTYTIQYKLASSSVWSSTTASTNSKSLSGLVSGTAYHLRVATTCPYGTSAYSTTVNFTTLAAAACGVPTNLAISAISATGATAAWTAVSGATQYTIQYKTAAATAWTSVTSTTASRVLTGLTATTTYNLKVMATCSGGSSTYTAVSNFTTSAAAASCGIPTNVAANNITANTAVIYWTAVSGATSYTIQYKLGSSSIWSTTTATTNTKLIQGLVAGTAYNVKVMSTCASGTSAYSAIANFATLPTTVSFNNELAYCQPATNENNNQWIEQVNMGDWENVSGNNNGYADYSVLYAEVVRGNTYTVQLNAHTADNAVWHIWIDYNQDGVFDNDTETAFNQHIPNPTAHITIPSDVYIGEARMRIALGDHADACANTMGEIEDYTLHIQPQQAVLNDLLHLPNNYIESVQIGNRSYASNDNGGFEKVGFAVQADTQHPIKLQAAWVRDTPAQWLIQVDYNNNGNYTDPNETQIIPANNATHTSAYWLIPNQQAISNLMPIARISLQHYTADQTLVTDETETYHLALQSNQRNLIPINNARTCDDVDVAFNYGVEDNELILENTTVGKYDTWLWQFGDGTTSTQHNPQHHYQRMGTYAVSLTVTDTDKACQATTELKVFISSDESGILGVK